MRNDYDAGRGGWGGAALNYESTDGGDPINQSKRSRVITN